MARMLISYPLDESYIESAEAMGQAARISPLHDYIFDSSSFNLEVSMVYSTIMKYLPLLQCGLCESEEETLAMIDEFNAMLQASGIDDLIAANQEQLDYYLAE